MMEKSLDEFLVCTKPLRDACKAIEIAAVLVRLDGAWHVAAGRVALWPWTRDSGVAEVVSCGDVVAVSLACHAGELPAILDGLRSSRLRLPGWRGCDCVPLRCANSSPASGYLELYRERARDGDGLSADWPAHSITLTGQYGQGDTSDLREARDLLVTASTPFLDWTDLLRDLGFAPSQRDLGGRAPWISVSAIVPARLHGTQSSRAEIRADVEVLPGFAAMVRMSVIQEGAARGDRRLVPVEVSPGVSDGPVVTTLVVTPPRSNGPVHLILCYDGWACDRGLVGVPDGRAAVHELFDPEGRGLRTQLDPKMSQAELLEESFTWLLHLLGLAAARYGHKWLNGSPDVVAFADGGRVLVCECTWGPVDPDMVTKVKHRAGNVASVLRAVGFGAKILPVAVTATEPAVDDEDPAGPREQGVALLTQKDLQEWAQRASRGEGLEPFWESITERGSPLPSWRRRRGSTAGLLTGLG